MRQFHNNAARVKYLEEEATPEEILHLWRFVGSDSHWLKGEAGTALLGAYGRVRRTLSTDEWVELSKRVGWDE